MKLYRGENLVKVHFFKIVEDVPACPYTCAVPARYTTTSQTVYYHAPSHLLDQSESQGHPLIKNKPFRFAKSSFSFKILPKNHYFQDFPHIVVISCQFPYSVYIPLLLYICIL